MLKFEIDRTRRGIARILCLVALALVATTATAQQTGQDDGSPTILARDAKLYVHYDGSVDVSEITRVNAVAPRIFHRDLVFPGRKVKPDDIFVLEASENDATVNAEVTQLGDGVRISIPQPTRRIGPREFDLEYRLLYGVRDQQLDWPLTSASNPLPVQQASLRVTLPEETPSDQIHAQFQLDGANLGGAHADNAVTGTHVSLTWPQGIKPGQALSAVLTFPEVSDSSMASNTPHGPAWLHDGRAWLALLVLYYLVVKFAFTGRRDNQPVIAEYAAPSGWSAAAVRLLWHNGYDHKCFSAGILGIAAKGGLTLDKRADGAWVATRTGADEIPALTLDERALRAALFTFNHTITFTGPDADSLDVAETSFRGILESRCASERPMSLAGLLIPGWIIAVFGAVNMYSAGRNPAYLAAELIGATTVAAIAVAVLTKTVPGGLLRAIKVQGLLAAVVCVGARLARTGTIQWLWIVALLGGQVAAACWLLRQHGKETPLLLKIHGFRWYLATAEQQDMQARYKPSLHPELQASLLPYAMALDVEVEWNAHFARTAKSAEPQDFIAGIDRESSAHADAAADLLNFAQSMARRNNEAAVAMPPVTSDT